MGRDIFHTTVHKNFNLQIPRILILSAKKGEHVVSRANDIGACRTVPLGDKSMPYYVRYVFSHAREGLMSGSGS